MIRMELCKRLTFNGIRPTGARGQGPGAGNSINLGGRLAATTAYGAISNGEVLARVVVVGRGFEAIEDSIGSL